MQPRIAGTTARTLTLAWLTPFVRLAVRRAYDCPGEFPTDQRHSRDAFRRGCFSHLLIGLARLATPSPMGWERDR